MARAHESATVRSGATAGSHALLRHAGLLLAAIFVIGVAARLYRLLPFAIWGSDSGEYYYLTERLLETGRTSFAYHGWGLAYPYFPGMFVLVGAVSATTGLDLLTSLRVVVPVLAALVPVLVALVAHRVTRDARVALLAGAFLAVTAPHVMVTSHAMPGTLGHLFLVAIALLLLDARRDRAALALLAVAGAALLLTHHLSTYFAVGLVAGAAFLREIGARRTSGAWLALEVPVTLALLGGTLVWWLGVAAPFRDEIVGDGLLSNPWLNALGFTLALAALPAAVALKRRALPWTWRARFPPLGASARLLAGAGSAVFLVCAAFLFVGIPGSSLTVTPLTLLFVLPPIALIAFAIVGTACLRFHEAGWLVAGWTGALLASLAFALATGSRVLFPFRHVDYLMEPVAIALAVGVVALAEAWRGASRAPARAGRLAVGLVAFALLANAAASQPPRETIAGFEEGVTRAEFAAVLWARDHPEVIAPGATIAADHRVSSLLFGFARLNATWDETYRTFHGETAEEALDELRALDVASGRARRIDYVFLSPVTREGVTLKQWENSEPMSERAWAKFFDDPRFEPVYTDAANDVHVFRVAWERA